MIVLSGATRFSWRSARVPILSGVVLAIAIPGLLFGVPNLKPDMVGEISGKNSQIDDLGLAPEMPGPSSMSANSAATAVEGTATPQRSCQDSVRTYLHETRPHIEQFGRQAMGASQEHRLALGATISEMNATYSEMRGVAVPACASDTANKLLNAHKRIIGAFSNYLAGGSENILADETGVALTDIENSLAQLSARAQGLATPMPKPKPTSVPLPTLVPTPTPLQAGNPIQIGNWEIRIDDVQVANHIGSSLTGNVEKAKGRFVVLFLDVTNRGYSSDNFIGFGVLGLKDTHGYSYEYNLMASTFAEEEFKIDFWSSIDPDQTAKGVAVFDIPSGSGATFVLGPGNLATQSSGQVYVDVP